jgi:hypothetical protein
VGANSRLPTVDAGRRGVNREAQEGECSVALPQSGLVPKQPSDGFVRIGGDVVFHLDVLKLPLANGDASDGGAGEKTKKQMSLDLDDWW